MSDEPLSLFEPAIKPSARTGDPDTSHAAAAAVTYDAAHPVRAAILDVLRTFGPSTDAAIAHYVAEHHPEAMTSPSGLRTRRNELVTLGLVEDTGQRVPTYTGRRTAVWQAVPV